VGVIMLANMKYKFQFEMVVSFMANIDGVGKLWFLTFEDIVVGVETKSAPLQQDKRSTNVLIPGERKNTNPLILRYLMGENLNPLLHWFDLIQQGVLDYRNMSVIFYSSNNKPRYIMHFTDAFPSSVRLSYGTKNSPVSVLDSVEFRYERIQREELW
jgi:hypothetical protein